MFHTGCRLLLEVPFIGLTIAAAFTFLHDVLGGLLIPSGSAATSAVVIIGCWLVHQCVTGLMQSSGLWRS
jgi:hypothetical protein